jgi:hypothetical protein
MKASGVNIIAAYVIWLHYEEVEGQFDWNGDRRVRHFVELCARYQDASDVAQHIIQLDPINPQAKKIINKLNSLRTQHP